MFKVPATYRSPEVRCTEHETPFSNDGVAPEGAACIDESRRADSSSSSLRRSSLTGDGGPAGGPSSTAGDVGGSSVLPRDEDFCSGTAADDDDPAEGGARGREATLSYSCWQRPLGLGARGRDSLPGSLKAALNARFVVSEDALRLHVHAGSEAKTGSKVATLAELKKLNYSCPLLSRRL